MPPLSDAAIRRIKPSGRTQRLFDSGGLYLEVTPRGSLCWWQKYRFGGKEKRLAHGTYPDVPLTLARTRRDEARRLLAQGMDPSEQKKAAAAAQETLGSRTFKATAQEWLPKRKWAPSYRVSAPWVSPLVGDATPAACRLRAVLIAQGKGLAIGGLLARASVTVSARASGVTPSASAASRSGCEGFVVAQPAWRISRQARPGSVGVGAGWVSLTPAVRDPSA